ncbi:MAG: PEFG-CTERM sorting domain-containing protein [Nitrosopumilaceae archaeon]|nr:PEFG-CTERM sorting domain-containing protein [Nitrosopumilaceae archaeon]
MTKTVLVFSILAAMLVFAPSAIMGQTDVGVESETKAEVGVKAGSETESETESGSESSAEAETKAQAKGEVKAQSETKSSEQSQEKSQSSSSSETKAQTSLGNMQVTTRADIKAKVGLPAKYPMPAVSASNSFSLQTNQHLYKPGDMITVQGSIWTDLMASLSGSDTVTVKLLDKQRNVVYETESKIASDGKYSAEFMMPSDAAKGSYTVTTSVNTDADLSGIVGLKGKANLGASTKVAVVPPQVFKVNVENHGDFDVKVATNSTVKDVKFNGDQKKVSVTVEGQSGTKGVSHISIPKSMVSGDFMVMIDGKAVANDKVIVTQHTEAETEVEVNYNHSVHTIDVVGTQAVPEFGTVAVLILTVAILSIVAISARSKLSLVPKI